MMGEDPEDRVDPMSRIFPRLTKCTFNKFGPSGTVQRRDAMCVLPVNIINEVRQIRKYLPAKHESFLENLCVPVVLAASPGHHNQSVSSLQCISLLSSSSEKHDATQ